LWFRVIFEWFSGIQLGFFSIILQQTKTIASMNKINSTLSSCFFFMFLFFFEIGIYFGVSWIQKVNATSFKKANDSVFFQNSFFIFLDPCWKNFLIVFWSLWHLFFRLLIFFFFLLLLLDFEVYFSQDHFWVGISNKIQFFH